MTGLILALVLRLVQPAHPIHTTVAELQDGGTGTTSIRIRVFQDDFTEISDSAMSRYVRERFAVTDRAGRPIVLQWESAEHSGAVLLLRFLVSLPGGLAGSTVKSGLLCDRFEDQVNIVRASYGGRITTLLFTPGDGAKALP